MVAENSALRVFDELAMLHASGEDVDLLKLGRLHRTGVSLLPLVLCELDAADPSRRAVAAAVLGQLDDVPTQSAVTPLLQAEAVESSPVVRAMRVDALGFRGGLPRSPAATYEVGSEMVRVSLAKAFAATNGDAGGECVLARLLEDESEGVLCWATQAAANRLRAGEAEWTAALLRLLQHPESEIAGEALVGLAGGSPGDLSHLLLLAERRGDLADWLTEARDAAREAVQM